MKQEYKTKVLNQKIPFDWNIVSFVLRFIGQIYDEILGAYIIFMESENSSSIY